MVRHAVGDARGLDLRLRAGDALRHRRLRHEEARRDLRDGEPAEQAQGQGHPRLRREGRVAAGEDRAGAGRPRRVRSARAGCRRRSSWPPGAWCRAGTRGGSGRWRGCRRSSSASRRVGRDAVGRPPLDRSEQGLARRVLGDVEIAESAGERGHHPAVLLAVDPIDPSVSVRGRWLTRPGTDGPRPAPQAFDPSAAILGRRRGRGLDDPEPTEVVPWSRRTGRR